MNSQPTAMERAFELARSGTVATIDDIRAKLRAEGLDHLQIQGPSLLKQLRGMIAAAQT
ncbi:MAG: hypothetical protein WDN76_09745 [Alphaproteobacteria bacterium]